MATARQARLPLQLGHASPHLYGAVPDPALLLLVRSEFVCWHAFLASRRIDCQAADFAIGAGLKGDSKGKLGGEEISLPFRTDPELRKAPVRGRFARQDMIFTSHGK